jgi:adenine-specific DNA-methyltransferase
MEKMKFETKNLASENKAKIAEVFPGAVVEGKVNFDLLRSLLGDDVFGGEAYEFTWVGKRAAIAEAGRPIRKTLRPCVEESKEWDATENLYIEGDNLDVLKLLQESYLGNIKMIYIDPPYNTGGDFIYKDDFKKSREEYERETGEYDDETGERLFRNTENRGRFHSDWCGMIYPRLVLGRNLLCDDGVIFISIDDNEQENLKKICDEVFGASNYISQAVWQKFHSVKSNALNNISNSHEYVLIYAKDASAVNFNKIPMTDEALKVYKNPDKDPRGVWRTAPLTVGLLSGARGEAYARTGVSTGIYEIIAPNGKRHLPTAGRCWFTKPKIEQLRNDNRIWWGIDGNAMPMQKIFLSEKGGVKVANSIWLHSEYGSNKKANEEMKKLFPDVNLSLTPKPTLLIRKILEMATGKNDIILDFFSGSSTVAHAVMQLNAEDGGARKFIMVQLPEVCAEGTEAAKAGYKTICEIGKERIRRAGAEIKSESAVTAPNLDVGFRVLKLGDANMADVYYAPGDYTQDLIPLMENNIKPDRTDMDLLYSCLLDLGLPLSMPHTREEIDGFTVHTCNGGGLIACFDEHISEKAVREIARRKPSRAVFRDGGFADSSEKINVFKIFKQLAPDMPDGSVRVI